VFVCVGVCVCVCVCARVCVCVCVCVDVCVRNTLTYAFTTHMFINVSVCVRQIYVNVYTAVMLGYTLAEKAHIATKVHDPRPSSTHLCENLALGVYAHRHPWAACACICVCWLCVFRVHAKQCVRAWLGLCYAELGTCRSSLSRISASGTVCDRPDPIPDEGQCGTVF